MRKRKRRRKGKVQKSTASAAAVPHHIPTAHQLSNPKKNPLLSVYIHIDHRRNEQRRYVGEKERSRPVNEEEKRKINMD